MVASAKHEGVVFVVTPTHGDKRSGVCDAGGLLIGSGLFLHVDVCVNSRCHCCPVHMTTITHVQQCVKEELGERSGIWNDQ